MKKLSLLISLSALTAVCFPSSAKHPMDCPGGAAACGQLVLPHQFVQPHFEQSERTFYESGTIRQPQRVKEDIDFLLFVTPKKTGYSVDLYQCPETPGELMVKDDEGVVWVKTNFVGHYDLIENLPSGKYSIEVYALNKKKTCRISVE